jgi:hypothetical protein
LNDLYYPTRSIIENLTIPLLPPSTRQ